MSKKNLIPWELTRCRSCRYFPNCPRNGDIRGYMVPACFAEICELYESANKKHVNEK